MAPPHTRFKPSFHNRLSHLSRHLFNSAESQHSSIKTVIPVHEDDDPDLSDRPRNISVDGLNQGLILPEEPEIDHIDCISSENHLSDEHACSTISSFEAGNFAVGSPRHVKEPHVARQSVIHSTSTIVQGTTVSTTYHAAVTSLPTSTSPTSTSSTHTSSPSTTTSINSSSQLELSETTTPQTSPQQSTVTSSSHTVYSTLTSPSDKPTDTPTSHIPITTATTTSLQPVLASATASLDGTVMISSQLAQSTSVPQDTNSNPQSPPSPHTAAIVGGVIGAIVLLALLIFIAIWYRRKRHRHSVTPFILPSTTETTPVESAAWIKFQSIGDAVRPSSGGPLSPQYSDACLAEYGNRYPSFVTDPVSSHLPSDDDVFASTRIAQRQRANGLVTDPVSSHLPSDDDVFASTRIAQRRRANRLEKLYPYPPRARTSGHYCRSSVENWIDQVVMEEDGSREPSEVLPEYRSAKSLRSGEADDDDDCVLPSSYPPLP